MNKTRQMALCGCLAALAVTVLLLAGVIPVATYCGPVLAAAMLIPVQETCGKKLAWVWYGAVSILAMLLCPDPECALLFVCVGYYPIIRSRLDAIGSRVLRLLAKLGFFQLALGVLAVLLGLLLGLEALLEVYLSDGLPVFLLTWLLGNCTFLVTDRVLARLELLWRRKYSKS